MKHHCSQSACFVIFNCGIILGQIKQFDLQLHILHTNDITLASDPARRQISIASLADKPVGDEQLTPLNHKYHTNIDQTGASDI